MNYKLVYESLYKRGIEIGTVLYRLNNKGFYEYLVVVSFTDYDIIKLNCLKIVLDYEVNNFDDLLKNESKYIKVDLKDTKKYKLIGKAVSLKVANQDYNRLISYSILRMNLRVGTIARIPVGDSFRYFVVIKEDTANDIYSLLQIDIIGEITEATLSEYLSEVHFKKEDLVLVTDIELYYFQFVTNLDTKYMSIVVAKLDLIGVLS